MREDQPIWKHPDFPAYYHNERAVEGLETEFLWNLQVIQGFMKRGSFAEGLGELLTEETVKSSLIFCSLDREVVKETAANGITIKVNSLDQGAFHGLLR